MEKRRYNKGFHISFNKNRLNKKVAQEEKVMLSDLSTRQSETIQTLKEKSDHPTLKNQTKKRVEVTEILSSKSEKTEQTVALDESMEAVPFEEEKELANNEFDLNTDMETLTPKEGRQPNAFWYFTLLGVLPILLIQRKRSYNIGKWAASNVTNARVTMAGLYALGFSSSFLMGNLWQPLIEEWMLVIPLTIAGGVLVTDAVKKNQESGYLKRQMSSVVVNVSSFFGTFAMGAQSKINVIQRIDPDLQMGENTVATIIITILLVAAMTMAILGITAIACNLLCNGYGISALIVMAGGAFLIFFLGVWAILNVIRGRSKNRENMMTGLIIGIVMALLILIPIGISALL